MKTQTVLETKFIFIIFYLRFEIKSFAKTHKHLSYLYSKVFFMIGNKY